MSTLLVDAGNARLKWAVLEGNLRDGAQVSGVQALELRGSVEQALEALSGALSSRIDAVVVGNVAGPQFGEQLARVLESSAQLTVWFARSLATSCGVRNAYPQPHTLGVDRWAAIVAGFRRARSSAPGEAVCIVDAGTALTIDAVDAAGRHLGGLILPGLRLQQEALFDAAADISLPPASPMSPPPGPNVLANSTAEALARSGRFACSAAIDRCVRRLAGRSGSPHVLLSGGDAEALAPWLESRAQICPNLVFEGLALLFEERMTD